MYLHSRMRGFLPAAIALLLCVSGCADDAPNNKEVSAQEVSQISAPADGTMSKDGLVKKDSTRELCQQIPIGYQTIGCRLTPRTYISLTA